MRSWSQRQLRRWRMPLPSAWPSSTSMPYSECRSASISAHCVSSFDQLRSAYGCGRGRPCFGAGMPPSYHS